MTKPTDDLEAVRIVAEALQGFDARDQDRIIRWAREKLGQVAPPPPRPAPPPPAASEPVSFTVAASRPAPPPATSPVRIPEIVEPPVVEVYQEERAEEEQAVVEQPEVQPVVEERSEAKQPGAVNLLMPPPEKKSRAFLIVGIILLALAVAFLIVLIVPHGK